jgi:predicted DsbA family dithiol-disulfide isomerase
MKPAKEPAMPPIDLHLFADFVCPWCYIGTERLDRLAQDYELRVQWHPFLLRADTPPEGVPITDIFPADELADKLAYVQQAVEAAGLPFQQPQHIPNTLLAHEAAYAAAAAGAGEAFHRAVLRAYFVDGYDIGDAETLAGIGETVGLDGTLLLRALQQGTYRDAVVQAIRDAHALGVNSVPTFIFGTGAAFAGAQPYEVIQQIVERHVLPALAAEAPSPDPAG